MYTEYRKRYLLNYDEEKTSVPRDARYDTYYRQRADEIRSKPEHLRSSWDVIDPLADEKMMKRYRRKPNSRTVKARERQRKKVKQQNDNSIRANNKRAPKDSDADVDVPRENKNKHKKQ